MAPLLLWILGVPGLIILLLLLLGVIHISQTQDADERERAARPGFALGAADFRA
jgi:hypothetical protein